MENTMGNDMDSTNPTTGFSFINDSLVIDDSSLVLLVFVKPHTHPLPYIFRQASLPLNVCNRLAARLVVTQNKKPHIKTMCGENQNYILVKSTSLTGLVDL